MTRPKPKRLAFVPVLVKKTNKLNGVSIFFNVVLSIISLLLSVMIILSLSRDLWWRLFRSLQKLTVTYAVVGWIGLFCVLSFSLGVLGVYAVRRKASLVMGVQVFALIFLIVLEAGILYAITSQWLNNLEVGVIASVQLFTPALKGETTMASIQESLRCCGRGAPSDYGIANEAVKKHFVPFSCCDLSTFEWEDCKNASVIANKKIKFNGTFEENTLAYIIPRRMAYKAGCIDRLYNILLPIIVAMFTILMSMNLFTTIIDCWYMQKAAEEEELLEAWKTTQSFLKGSTANIVLSNITKRE